MALRAVYRRYDMFKIFTDNGSDIPEDYAREHNIETLNLATIIDGVVYNQGVELKKDKFYEMLAAGAKPSTSQINPEQAKQFFEEHIADADEFLFICISSGLSGTFHSLTVGASPNIPASPHPSCVMFSVMEEIARSFFLKE